MTPRAAYGRIARAYVRWARILLPLAVIIFVPLGLIEAISVHADLDSNDFGSGLVALGLLAAVVALIGTSLLGEVFYSGAVAVSLTHGESDGPLTLREISRHLAYGRLIAVDLIYGALVVVGLLLLVVPGVLLYIWLALAGPVVEIERRGVREAFARSRRLVRGRFWLIVAVLAPIELASEAVGALATSGAESALGHSIWAEWLAASLSNIAITPFFAVATVLLAVELIWEKDGRGPRLHSAPSRP